MSRNTTAPSRRRSAAARRRSKAQRETPRERGQGAVPVTLVAAQARFGEGPGRAVGGCPRNQGTPRRGRTRRGATGSKHGPAACGYAEGARLRVPGFPAPWSGREAAPVRAQKTLPRSAFQRNGRARHVHRRLFQAGPDSGGDAEVAEASEPAALPGGGGGKGQGDRRRSRRCGRGNHAGDGGAAPSGCVGRRARGARARVSARPGCDASDKARLIRFMALDDKTLKLCNCNRTMALDPKALAGALKLTQPIEIHTELCRKQVASFHGALKDEACVIACTQEAPP